MSQSDEKLLSPLMPRSIAVGLSDDLLQYGVELKFLLLFFDRPVAILSSAGGNFLPEDAVSVMQAGKNIQTNLWGSGAITSLDYLVTEEWSELLSCCDLHYSNLTIDYNNPIPDPEVDEICASKGGLHELTEAELMHGFTRQERTEKEKNIIFSHLVFRLEMRRLIKSLQLCLDRRVPMVWGCGEDRYIVDQYGHFLLQKKLNDSDEEIRRSMRIIRGQELLKNILSLEIVNLATVPVEQIVKFRRTNSDLLDSFLLNYRKFLQALESDPKSANSLAKSHAEDLSRELENIKQELLLLRKQRNYAWLRRLSQGVYESAAAGAAASIWSLASNPLLFAGAVGALLARAGSKLTEDLIENKEKEDALLFKASAGYLWKAHTKFRNG